MRQGLPVPCSPGAPGRGREKVSVSMPQVDVSLYATLRRYRPEAKEHRQFQVAVPEGASVAQLLEILGVPRGEVKMVFVNHLRAGDHQVLQENDNVGIFPPIAGG